MSGKGLILIMLYVLGICAIVFAVFFMPRDSDETARSGQVIEDVFNQSPDYAVIAGDKTYFTGEYEESETGAVLYGYWDLIGREMRFNERILILDKSIVGEIIISRRG